MQIRADPATDDVRRRMTLAFAAMFIGLMAVATLEGFWPGGPGPAIAVVLLIACAVVAPFGMAVLSRPVLRDIDLITRENARLRELYGRAREDALLDGMTGLGNHRGFQEELVRQLDQAERTGSALALLLIDVDDLKRVNDERGHASGDRLLVAFGEVARASLRRNDRAFRVGGDEFAILLPGSDLDSGLTIARRLLAGALKGGDPSHPVEPFSLSIGVSAYPAPSNQGSQLYRHADAALYWCKRHGRTNAAAYDPGRHGIATDDRSIEDLTEAISAVLAGEMLRPVYQPIFSLTTGEPVGYEALIRPTDGAPIADASTLFAAAERTDRTVEMDLACLKVVAEGAGELEPNVYLSVNLSPRTLESELFHPRALKAIFERRGIHTSQLVVELTEREEVNDLDGLRRNAAACREAGIRLAADDVGAGNAGLRLLSEIQFDIVKIDLSLVQGGILHDPAHAVLRALQELASRWQATTVAEGVETAEQLAAIRELGITTGQGYLLGRPSRERRVKRIDIESLLPQAWVELADDPAA
ncbi:MAG: EAL domain-containing protein [Chloroflexota bacterium]